MRRCVPVLVLALAFGLLAFRAASLFAQGQDWRSLVDTEKAFARAADEKGIRAAFLEYLAGGSLVFTPGPTPGRPYYEKLSPDLASRLIWKPSWAEVARSGELGYTTGPYELYANKTAKTAADHGHYVTVWKKTEGGEWKAVLDIGVSHPAPRPSGDEVGSPAETPSSSRTPLSGFEFEQAKQKLRSLEAAFSKAWLAGGAAKAYPDHASDRVRVCREGNNPVTGLKAAMNLLSRAASPSSWSAEGADVSAADDLAYTYGQGRYVVESAPEGASGRERMFSFVHIWRRAPDGAWRLVLDIAIPHPSR